MKEVNFILQIKKSSEFKADRIYSEILIAYPNQSLRQSFWKNEQLPLAIRNFLLVYEWLAFEDYESFDVALNLVYTDKMLNFIYEELKMTDLVIGLQNLKKQIDKIYPKNDNLNDINRLNEFNSLRDSPLFRQIAMDYGQQKSAIFDRLIEYVARHADVFP